MTTRRFWSRWNLPRIDTYLQHHHQLNSPGKVPQPLNCSFPVSESVSVSQKNSPENVTWQAGKSTILNRTYIFKWWIFHCHVGFLKVICEFGGTVVKSSAKNHRLYIEIVGVALHYPTPSPTNIIRINEEYISVYQYSLLSGDFRGPTQIGLAKMAGNRMNKVNHT